MVGIASPRRRLDQELLRRELFSSREQARRAIAAGDVTVNGAPADKPARMVLAGDAILVHKRQRFVGRGGDKMAGALERFGLDVTGLHCIDVGSSTGGFTDCLLQQGAASVVAVDVGTHQLHERLRGDPRVDVREQTDIRAVEPESLTRLADLLVCDVSFIGIDAVFPTMRRLGTPQALHVLLIKPQFEAGKQEASRGKGVIRDPEIWKRVLDEAAASIAHHSGAVMAGCVSPLKGGSGNVEFFFLVRSSLLDDPGETTVDTGTMVAEAEDLT